MEIRFLHPRCTLEHLGEIPFWLGEGPKTAKQQLNDGYRFGGFNPFKGFKLLDDDSLKYPGDPPQKPIAEFIFSDRTEKVVMYQSAWVAVIQEDRSFEVCRMD